MSMYRGAYARPMREILDEAIDILRTDASEYAYIGLVGAVAAAIAVLIPSLVGGAVAVSLIGPLVVLIAVMTMATSAAAFGNVTSHLQPEAGAAFREAAIRSVSLLRPWLLLIAVLWSGSFAAAMAAPYMGPVPPMTVAVALVAFSVFYVFPRSLYTPAIFEHDVTPREAIRASVALVDRAAPRVRFAWAVVCAPAALVGLLGVPAGVDFVVAAIAAFFFVAALPVAAALMALLFIDTASLADAAAHDVPPVGAAGVAQRRV